MQAVDQQALLRVDLGTYGAYGSTAWVAHRMAGAVSPEAGLRTSQQAATAAVVRPTGSGVSNTGAWRVRGACALCAQRQAQHKVGHDVSVVASPSC